MKKSLLIVLVAMCLLATSCSRSELSQYFVAQHTFEISDLQDITPQGLQYGTPAGKNWWRGTYEGEEVLIHAVVSDSYVNVEFQFLP